MTGRQIGYSRNDSRQPRLPKDQTLREQAMVIREFAKNNGISIRVAKVMFEEAEEEEIKSKTFKHNRQGICPVCEVEGNLEYGDYFIDDCIVKFPWKCDDCGASGKELYNMEFTEHCSVEDKDGNAYENQD